MVGNRTVGGRCGGDSRGCREGLSAWAFASVVATGFVMGAALIPSLALGVETATATEAMKSTITEVIALLEDEDLKRPERAKERRHRLEEVIGNRFDYAEMAKRALGAEWKKRQGSEQQEFVQLFTALLARSYVDKIEGYTGEQIEYINERRKEDYAEVKTLVISGKAEIPLNYRLLKSSSEWRVYDVVVDGVSLVRNYRGQFSKVIRSSSYEELVIKLKEKVNKPAGP